MLALAFLWAVMDSPVVVIGFAVLAAINQFAVEYAHTKMDNDG